MTIEALLALILLLVFCCYLVYRWQQAVVDQVLDTPAPEPYPVPETEPTTINPQAAWPFPHSKP